MLIIAIFLLIVALVELDEWANREVWPPTTRDAQVLPYSVDHLAKEIDREIDVAIGWAGSIYNYDPSCSPFTTIMLKLKKDRHARLIHCRAPGVSEVETPEKQLPYTLGRPIHIVKDNREGDLRYGR
jgi:hypothetical protein